MAGKKPIGRKRRTRQHVIADLGINHVERHVLLCGFSVERVLRDYGLDLTIYTFDVAGEAQNGYIRVQVKATDHLKVVREGKSVAVRISQANFRHWLLEPQPVILMVYAAPSDIAYWLWVQAYFEELRGIDLDEAGEVITIHIPTENILDQGAIRKFAEFRDQMLTQERGRSHHG